MTLTSFKKDAAVLRGLTDTLGHEFHLNMSSFKLAIAPRRADLIRSITQMRRRICSELWFEITATLIKPGFVSLNLQYSNMIKDRNQLDPRCSDGPLRLPPHQVVARTKVDPKVIGDIQIGAPGGRKCWDRMNSSIV